MTIPGLMMGLSAPDLAGLAAQSGFERVIIDCEHGLLIDGDIRPMAVAIQHAGAKCLVRIGKTSLGSVGVLADAGIDGFVLSAVERLEEMSELAALATFPDSGRRGVNPFVAAARSPGDLEQLRASADELELWAMAETPGLLHELTSVASSTSITRFPWTGILIGPYDLATAVRARPDPADPALSEAVGQFAQAASSLGLSCGMFVRDEDAFDEWLALGLDPDLVVLGYDRDVWFQACRQRVMKVRAAPVEQF